MKFWCWWIILVSAPGAVQLQLAFSCLVSSAGRFAWWRRVLRIGRHITDTDLGWLAGCCCRRQVYWNILSSDTYTEPIPCAYPIGMVNPFKNNPDSGGVLDILFFYSFRVFLARWRTLSGAWKWKPNKDEVVPVDCAPDGVLQVKLSPLLLGNFLRLELMDLSIQSITDDHHYK